MVRDHETGQKSTFAKIVDSGSKTIEIMLDRHRDSDTVIVLAKVGYGAAAGMG